LKINFFFLGVGIPEDHIPKLFQRFYRVESRQSRSHEGTGIGLALVQELIHRHGGDISVKSVVDQGSTFKVRLPTGWEHLPPKQVYFDEEHEKPRDKQLFLSRDLYIEDSEQWIQRNQAEEPDDADHKFVKDMGLNDLKFSFSTLETGKETIENDRLTFPLSWDDPLITNDKKYKILVVDDNTDMR